MLPNGCRLIVIIPDILAGMKKQISRSDAVPAPGIPETLRGRLILARNMRQLRRQQGLSQEGLAERAGIHRTYVGSVERCERNISIDNIGRLARALGVEPYQLLVPASET